MLCCHHGTGVISLQNVFVRVATSAVTDLCLGNGLLFRRLIPPVAFHTRQSLVGILSRVHRAACGAFL